MIPQPLEDVQPTNNLDVMARLVYSSVDGRLSIAEIGSMCGIEHGLTQRIVYSLVVDSMLRVPGFEPGAQVKAETPGSAQKSEFEQELDAIHSSLERKNYYQILDVDPDVSRKGLRDAYFRFSKRFHPDKVRNKSTEAMKPKIEIVFRHVTEAYNTLSNPKSRSEYDLSVKDFIELRTIEKKLESAIKGKDAGQDQPPPSPPPEQSVGKQSITPPVERAAAKPQSQRLPSQPLSEPDGEEAVANVDARPSTPPRPVHDARRQQWRRERAGRAMAAILKRSSSSPPSLSVARRRLQEAEIAIEQERFGDAIRFLNEALSGDPENAQAREMLVRAEEGNAWTIAQGHLRKGRLEQRKGNLQEATKHYERALAADSHNLDARHLLAEVMLDTREDLPRALSLAKEVVVMGGQRARYFATLGEILFLAKDLKRATEAYEKAVALEPDNKEYRKRLKACRK